MEKGFDVKGWVNKIRETTKADVVLVDHGDAGKFIRFRGDEEARQRVEASVEELETDSKAQIEFALQDTGADFFKDGIEIAKLDMDSAKNCQRLVRLLARKTKAQVDWRSTAPYQTILYLGDPAGIKPVQEALKELIASNPHVHGGQIYVDPTADSPKFHRTGIDPWPKGTMGVFSDVSGRSNYLGGEPEKPSKDN